MPRSPTPNHLGLPFHITSRCPNRVSFPLPLDQIWQIFERHLYYAHHVDGLKIHQFVLMPNHFHLIASVGDKSLGEVMKRLMREVSKDINAAAGKINQNFGGRYYKTVISHPRYAFNVYKYVYQNPLRANLCSYCEEWPWSTLHGLLGLRHLFVPLEPDEILFNPQFRQDILVWLNTRSEQKSLDEMRRYLKKGAMTPSVDRETGKMSRLESELI